MEELMRVEKIINSRLLLETELVLGISDNSFLFSRQSKKEIMQQWLIASQGVEKLFFFFFFFFSKLVYFIYDFL